MCDTGGKKGKLIFRELLSRGFKRLSKCVRGTVEDKSPLHFWIRGWRQNKCMLAHRFDCMWFTSSYFTASQMSWGAAVRRRVRWVCFIAFCVWHTDTLKLCFLLKHIVRHLSPFSKALVINNLPSWHVLVDACLDTVASLLNALCPLLGFDNVLIRAEEMFGFREWNLAQLLPSTSLFELHTHLQLMFWLLVMWENLITSISASMSLNLCVNKRLCFICKHLIFVTMSQNTPQNSRFTLPMLADRFYWRSRQQK